MRPVSKNEAWGRRNRNSGGGVAGVSAGQASCVGLGSVPGPEPSLRPPCVAAAGVDDSAPATVSVVDDDPGVRKSLRALLESAGLAAETYATGEEFLAAYDADRPGCLVLDIRLRYGNGLDVQDELRRRKTLLPIIVLTGYADVPTSMRARKAGAFDFLQKPVSPSVLLERIGAAIALDRSVRVPA